jgi:hypothetical protein
MGEEAFMLNEKGKKGERMGIKQAKRGRIGQEETHACSKGEVHSLKYDVSLST